MQESREGSDFILGKLKKKYLLPHYVFSKYRL